MHVGVKESPRLKRCVCRGMCPVSTPHSILVSVLLVSGIGFFCMKAGSSSGSKPVAQAPLLKVDRHCLALSFSTSCLRFAFLKAATSSLDNTKFLPTSLVIESLIVFGSLLLFCERMYCSTPSFIACLQSVRVSFVFLLVALLCVTSCVTPQQEGETGLL